MGTVSQIRGAQKHNTKKSSEGFKYQFMHKKLKKKKKITHPSVKMLMKLDTYKLSICGMIGVARRPSSLLVFTLAIPVVAPESIQSMRTQT